MEEAICTIDLYIIEKQKRRDKNNTRGRICIRSRARNG